MRNQWRGLRSLTRPFEFDNEFMLITHQLVIGQVMGPGSVIIDKLSLEITQANEKRTSKIVLNKQRYQNYMKKR